MSLLVALPGAVRAQVVVVANGSPITEYDIQQRAKLIASSTHKKATRKDIISELIDDRLKIAKAKSYGMEVTDQQVNNAFNNMAKRQGVSAERFTQFLQHAGISAETVKARIRAELTWGELIRGKYGPSLQVTEADIANAMRRQGASEAVAGYVYTLYPITFVVPTGSSEAAVAAKRREAENLRTRFDSCQQGLALARSLRDVAVREPITRTSAGLPQSLQDLLGKMEIGHLTTPDVTAQGLQMFALCGKKQTKAESPLKHQIRDKLYKERFEAASNQFLEEVRKSAMIEYK